MMKDLIDFVKGLIDRQAETDTEFKALLGKPNKSVEECAKYVLNQAMEQAKKNRDGNTSYWCGLDDSPIVGMIIHYYQEDNVKVEELPQGVAASVSALDSKPKKEKPKKEVKGVKPIRVKPVGNKGIVELSLF